MYDIALSSSSHDIVLSEDNDLILINNAERVAQQIKITLKFWLGEWFLNIGFGVPYLERILVKNPNMNHVYAIFKTKIMDVPDVKKINLLKFDLNKRDRKLLVSFEVLTEFGVVADKEVLGYGE